MIVLLLKSSEKKNKNVNLLPDKKACLPWFFLISVSVLFVNGVVVRECSSGNLCPAVSMSIRRNVGSIG